MLGKTDNVYMLILLSLLKDPCLCLQYSIIVKKFGPVHLLVFFFPQFSSSATKQTIILIDLHPVFEGIQFTGRV